MTPLNETKSTLFGPHELSLDPSTPIGDPQKSKVEFQGPRDPRGHEVGHHDQGTRSDEVKSTKSCLSWVTLRGILDLQEGPMSHLRDLWTTFQRVDLTSVGPTIPLIVIALSSQSYGRCGLGHTTAPPMRRYLFIGRPSLPFLTLWSTLIAKNPPS